MNLWEYEGKKVLVELKDGGTFSGVISAYTSALDNEPDGACIYIGHTEILESEIRSIVIA